jgi:hypothetical protein
MSLIGRAWVSIIVYVSAGVSLGLLFFGSASFAGESTDTFSPAASKKTLAVIFNGPTICDDCASLLGTVLKKRGLRVQYVKPGETTAELLSKALIYVVPGGEDVTDLKQAWSETERRAIRDFVQYGGAFYGVCLGGYWAGDWPGTLPGFKSLGLINAKVSAHSLTPEDRVEKIFWLGSPRWAYFQDGPSFDVHDSEAQILATYASDGTVAAFIQNFGRGKVAVNGVHFEAPMNWYESYHLVDPDGLDEKLLLEFFDRLIPL